MQQFTPKAILAVWLVGLLLPATLSLQPHERHAAFIGYHEHPATGVQDVVVLNSTYGQIRVKLRPDQSPKVVSLIAQLASSGRKCNACKFYRNEPVPQGWGQGGFYGPPYALLQGSLADIAEQPPFEGSPPVKKGDACIIPNTREFFIATADHVEWGHSHTVWGKVADEASWRVIHSIPTEPYTNRTDGAITTRWLTPAANVPFSISLEAAAAQPAPKLNSLEVHVAVSSSSQQPNGR